MKKLHMLAITLVVGSILASCSQQSDHEEIPVTESESPSKLEDSKLGQMVSGVKLQVVDGQSFKEAALTKVPQYYILYFSASW
ncbi:MAG: hypothetical protein P1V20_10730 [Verrucomicrobiales bacterium]|nr:hypothetical protein [Verrucomicrobiales bacterium]